MSLACEPESFDVVDPDGSEIEHPSTGGGQTVGAVDRTVAGDRREREVDASGSGNGVEESQNGRPAATSVDHLEVDRAGSPTGTCGGVSWRTTESRLGRS